MINYKNCVSDYEDVYILSENEKGIVKLVRNKETDQKLIVKNINGDCPTIYERLLLISHKDMPCIFEVWSENGGYCVVQEYIKGVTLYEKLAEIGKFSDKDVKNYALQLCDVLKLLHSQNPPIIHRDIKPSNVMIAEDGTIKLIDFDSSRITNASADTDTKHVVTKGFAPPEQYGFSQTDGRADIYSMGKLMYSLLTGKSDNNTKTYKGKFKAVIRKCTRLDPKQRYSNVKHLEKGLKKVLSIKHSILRAVNCIITVTLLLAVGFYFSGNNIPQKVIYTIQQTMKIRELPYSPDTYINKVYTSAFEWHQDLPDLRYDFGKAFYDNVPVDWSFEVTDDGKRLVHLHGIMWLPYFETEVTITFDVKDNFDYEIVQVNSDYLGILTTKEEIEGIFLKLVSFQYWDEPTE